MKDNYFVIYQYFFYAAAADLDSDSGIGFKNELFLSEQKLYLELCSKELERVDNLDVILIDGLKSLKEIKNENEKLLKNSYIWDYMIKQRKERYELILFNFLSTFKETVDKCDKIVELHFSTTEKFNIISNCFKKRTPG